MRAGVKVADTAYNAERILRLARKPPPRALL
jgi:hypothetical protein